MAVSRLALLFLAASSLARAHEHPADEPVPAQLGAVSFETSCKAEVAADLNRGVALLHSFWHDEAGRTFEKAVTADPDCAMAYWGQAMASFHLFASTPSPEDLAAGQRALTRASTAPEKSAREAAYLDAVGLLYPGYEPSRDFVSARKYANAMAALVTAYPNDIEARAFYALGLLASNAPGDTSLANSKKAVAMLYPLLRDHPEHPGFAHYIIHACDSPEMAQQGVEAARRYALIAPAAPHALHMPSHIFARLGLWQDDIRSNLASKAAAESATGAHIGAENRLHAMEFLEYAYLQRGQFEEARAIATEATGVSKADTRYADYYLTVQARFPSLLAIETQDWPMAASLQPIAGAHWYSHAQTLLANAMAAGHQRDADAGKKAADTFQQLVAQAPKKIPQGSSSAHIRDEVYAWAAFSRGDTESALRLLRPIAKRQAKAGKGEVELPAREMLAEMLLLEGKPREALDEYRLSLRTDPNRFNALVGAILAAEQSGGRELATEFRHSLSVLCPDANGTARATLVSLHVCTRQ